MTIGPENQSDTAYEIFDLRKLQHSRALQYMQRIRTLEKKYFPSNEVFAFDDGLLSKPNYSILAVSTTNSQAINVIAYAVVVRWKQRLLLHKICVTSIWRGKGAGKTLLQFIMNYARQSSCRGVDLWVDTNRTVARNMYSQHGFLEREIVESYYAPDRTGIKMTFDFD